MLERSVQVTVDTLQVTTFTNLGKEELQENSRSRSTLTGAAVGAHYLATNIEAKASVSLVDGDDVRLEDPVPPHPGLGHLTSWT